VAVEAAIATVDHSDTPAAVAGRADQNAEVRNRQHRRRSRGTRKGESSSRLCGGGITKTGNAHLRRIVIEAAWAYRHRPAVGGALRTPGDAQSRGVTTIAWEAQHRLHTRCRRLLGRSKCQQKVVTAIGRELLGFIWAIGRTVEADQGHRDR
jgi:hypothetical protein